MKPNWCLHQPERKLRVSCIRQHLLPSLSSEARKPWRGKAPRPISWTACRSLYGDAMSSHLPRPDPPPDRLSTGSRTLLDTPGWPMGPPLSLSYLTCRNLPLSPETRLPSALFFVKCSSSLTMSPPSLGHPKERSPQLPAIASSCSLRTPRDHSVTYLNFHFPGGGCYCDWLVMIQERFTKKPNLM